MSAMNRIVTMLLVVGAFFSGSTRQLLNQAKSAKTGTTICQGKADAGGRGSGGSGMGG